MKPPASILFQSFVKPFYKENAGFFVFVFTIMFFIVSKVDGAGLYEYHYSLVTGMLKNYIFFLLVLFIWLLYVRKYVVFVSAVILSPDHSFLHIYNQVKRTKRIRLFFAVETLLLLPVLLYVLFIVFVGLQQHLYLPLIIVACYLPLLLLVASLWHVYLLNHPDRQILFPLKKSRRVLPLLQAYPFTLIRFIFSKQPVIFISIKIITCGILYLVARNNSAADNDMTMAFIFYTFGLLSNGVLIFRVRNFEETYLHFYRSLPVSLTKRLLQYALVCLICLIPELVTAITLVPAHLNSKQAVDFIGCGFSLLLLMNSITFLGSFKMKEYIKILLLLFFIECVFFIASGLLILNLLFLIAAAIIFRKCYYTFEQVI